MGQKLSQKLKKEFEDYILLMQKKCSDAMSSGRFENCNKCRMIKQCRATSDRLVNFFAESIK